MSENKASLTTLVTPMQDKVASLYHAEIQQAFPRLTEIVGKKPSADDPSTRTQNIANCRH